MFRSPLFAFKRITTANPLRNITPARNLTMSTPSLPKTQTVVQFTRTGGPEVLETNTSAPLPTPTGDELLVKNTYAGVNYIDTYFRTGLYPAPAIPWICGREAEGTVLTAPPSSPFKPGDYIVYLHTSSQAQYTAVPPATAYRLPPSIPRGIGAAAILQGLTALTLIRESHAVQRGDSVLVHAAAGGVGLWLLQLLRATGAGKIIATASTEEKLALAKKNGATHTVNYRQEDWVGRVKEITREEGGVVAVFDGVGKDTFDGDVEVLARKGSLVSFGNASGAVPPLVISRLSPKNLKVLRPQLFGYISVREEFEAYCKELFELIEKKEVEVRVHKTYTLEEAKQAHIDIESRGTTGKLLYKISDE